MTTLPNGIPLANLEVTKLADLEKNELIKALFVFKGSITKAAKALGIGRATLYRKIEKYNLKSDEI
jgi:transcriptional regulator of acetoin/glycerol metabolism